MNNNQIYGLVDCNQFYVSCERAFAPYLDKKPVGVLSNNDGCIVALSPELKALGVSRGTPFFKIKEIINKEKVYLFSSNYELYGDMSSRVMNILSSMADDIEIYSIDEAFILFKGLKNFNGLIDYGIAIKNKIQKETGIPVSVGFGTTKTLSKIATGLAKKQENGVFSLQDHNLTIQTLQQTHIEDIWGIGRQYAKKMNKIGVYTAYDFINMPTYRVRKEMGVLGERTQMELKGISCIELETILPETKSIVYSRSFGKPVSELSDILESVSLYCSNAVKNLREKGLVAKNLTVFITTNPFKHTKQYANYIQGSLEDYSAYTPDFLNLGMNLMKKIYKEKYLYKKTGVMLTDIIKQDKVQPNIFLNNYGSDKRHLVMDAIDKINKQFGKNKIFYASNGFNNTWTMRREIISSEYTTNWNKLLVVK